MEGVCFRLTEGGRGLIEKEHLHRPVKQSASQIDDLALAELECRDHPVECEVIAAHLNKCRACGIAVGSGSSRAPSSEVEVVEDGQVAHECRGLVDDGDPELRRLSRGVGGDVLAVDQHPTACGSNGAGRHVHERRLSGAVMSEQADDLAGGEGQVDAVERAGDAEIDGDVVEGETWRGHAELLIWKGTGRGRRAAPPPGLEVSRRSSRRRPRRSRGRRARRCRRCPCPPRRR